jgi:glycosyltransferase involved in cell wall biosynthesis
VGIRRAKVTHIANGIDTTAFRVARDRPIARPLLGDFAPPGTRVVVNVARLDKVKDHAGLIAAFKLLQRDDVPATDCRLVIAGEGPLRGALERQIAELDLTRVVRLLGDRGDIAELLAESDVFALSSIAEGMPVTLLEAMAAGLPVAATDVGDVASVVADGVTGTLVPAHDPPALAAALGSYLADENRRRAHGDAARTRAMERFGLGAMVSAYVSLYDELLGTTHAAPLRAVPALTEHKEP